MKTILILFMLLIPCQSFASRLYLEKEYQNAFCPMIGGKVEVVLPDGSRADCVSDQYAIEFDFADKVYESIGQALLYGALLERYPGVVLIMEHPDTEQKYLDRLNTVARQRGIKVWVVTPAIIPLQ